MNELLRAREPSVAGLSSHLVGKADFDEVELLEGSYEIVKMLGLRLVLNLALRECLLKFLDSVVSHGRPHQVEFGQ